MPFPNHRPKIDYDLFPPPGDPSRKATSRRSMETAREERRVRPGLLDELQQALASPTAIDLKKAAVSAALLQGSITPKDAALVLGLGNGSEALRLARNLGELGVGIVLSKPARGRHHASR